MRSLLAVTCLAPTLAHANAVRVDVDVDVHVETTATEPVVLVEEPAPPPPPRHSSLRGHRWEAGVLFEGGTFELAGATGGQYGVRALVGRQIGALRLAVDYGMSSWSAQLHTYDAMGWWSGTHDFGGQVQRAGITARLRGVMTVDDPGCPCDLGLYVEGGAGRSWITTHGSSTVAERTDYLLGLGFEIAGGRQAFGGSDMGVRFIASPSMVDATLDIGIVGYLGATFGR